MHVMRKTALNCTLPILTCSRLPRTMPHVEDLGFRDVPNALGEREREREREGGGGGRSGILLHRNKVSVLRPASPKLKRHRCQASEPLRLESRLSRSVEAERAASNTTTTTTTTATTTSTSTVRGEHEEYCNSDVQMVMKCSCK